MIAGTPDARATTSSLTRKTMTETRTLRGCLSGAATAALAIVLVLAGCSALPTVNPDMAPAGAAPVQLQAASGRILSAERSREIIARATEGGASGDVVARHLAIEQAVSDAPLTIGNRVALLENGPATYRAMLAAIAAATDSINMETYILEEDGAGQRFAEALLARQAAGVQVALLHDSVGTLGTSKAYWQRLTDGGIKVLEYNPVNPLKAKAGWEVNQRDHRKLLVVDGRTAIMGGINISAVYSGSAPRRLASAPSQKGLPWRDTDLQLDGPVVAELQKLFLANWEQQKGEPLGARDYFPKLERQGNEIVRAIGSSPAGPFSAIYVTLLSAINSAESEILLTNAYFVPDPQLTQALIGAVARGVEVKMILPSVTDSSLVFHAGRAHYEELLAGGVKLYERREALLHAKTAVIDGVWSTVGSTNLDWRSFLHNEEVTAVVLGAGFGSTLRDAFERDLAVSDAIALEAWRQRPVGVKVKEAFARLWEYWL